MPEEDSFSKKNVSGNSGIHAAVGHKDAAPVVHIGQAEFAIQK